MRYYLLVLLACLVLALPVTAVTSNLPVVSCSASSFAEDPDNTIIWITFESGGSPNKLLIDGEAKMPMWALAWGGKRGLQFPVSPGNHTVVISSEGYPTYTADVQVCEKKVSYVFYDQALLVITPATTAVPTTAIPTAMVTVIPVTTTLTRQTMALQTIAVQTVPIAASMTTPPDMFGSLSVTTTPAGAFIFIDGVQRGVSPATIPGLSAGTHTLLLKLEGYQDLSTPVTIAAGKSQDYASGMVKNAAAVMTPAVTENPAATPKKVLGFEAVAALVSLSALLYLRNGSSR